MLKNDNLNGLMTRLLGMIMIVMMGVLAFLPDSYHSVARAETHIDPAELEAFFDTALPEQLATEHIPGAAVVVVHDGELIFARGYGLANVEADAPVDPYQTLFRTGSVGKLITWTAVMQLVEQGRLDLDADVNDYLDFTIPPAFGAPITLAHLLTHTPGFENVGEDLFHLSPDEMLPLRDYMIARMPARVYPPGQVGAYSNYGAALAGYIVERVSGEPFDAYVENHIFAPLGMGHSTVRQPLPTHLAPHMAASYGFVEGAYLEGEFIYVSPYPAGSMSAAPADMGPFMLAHLQAGRDGEAQILQPQTIDLMHSRHYSADPRLQGMVLGFMERRVNGRHVLYHKGSIVSFHTGLYLVREENLGLYIAYNGVNAALAPDPLFYAFMDRHFPGSSAVDAPALAGAEASLSQFTGEYHASVADYSTMGKIIRALETGQVVASPDGRLEVTVMGETDRYVQEEPGVFRSETRDELLIFQTDAQGDTWLLRDGEPHFALFKAPWYALAGVAGLTIVSGLLLFLGSGLVWGIVRLARRLRRRGQTNSSQTGQPSTMLPVARGASILFGVLLVVYLISFLNILGNVHPAYGAPMIMFGAPPGAEVLVWLPWLLAAVALGMIISMALVWATAGRNVNWGVWRRLHYTVLTLSATAIMGVLAYWNLWMI